jgi:hypothetical protein
MALDACSCSSLVAAACDLSDHPSRGRLASGFSLTTSCMWSGDKCAYLIVIVSDEWPSPDTGRDGRRDAAQKFVDFATTVSRITGHPVRRTCVIKHYVGRRFAPGC